MVFLLFTFVLSLFSSFVRFSVSSAPSSLCTALEHTLLLPCLSSGAPCSLRVRLPVPSQALNSIPHSPSPKGFKLFFIWCPFEHSIAGFRVPCSSLLGTVRGCKPKFLVLVCLASEGKNFWNLSPSGLCALPAYQPFSAPSPAPSLTADGLLFLGARFRQSV